MSVVVLFKYDEKSRKWDPIVHGATSVEEACQAFSAVVLSCQQLESGLLTETRTEVVDSFNVRIIPAVRRMS